jgi:hypothetical protein
MTQVLKCLAVLAVLLVRIVPAQTTSAPAPQSSQPIPVDQENAAKAKALVDQAIEALGGNAYLNISDITQEGRTYGFHHGEAEGVGVVFWRFFKYPDEERIELTKKRDIIYIYRGNEGFEITYKGTRADDPKNVTDYTRRHHYALDWVLRHWLTEPGVAMFYEGPAVAAQKEAQQVTIMNAQNEAVTLYFDVNTHLPVKKSYSWRDPTDKQRNVEEEVYDAYRSVDGVMTPFSITRFYNGDMANQRFLTSVTYNKGFSDTLFSATITYDPNKQIRR